MGRDLEMLRMAFRQQPAQACRVGILILLVASAFGITYTVTRAIQKHEPAHTVDIPKAPLDVSSSSPVTTQSAVVQIDTEAHTSGPPGMVWIPGGEFLMGTDDLEAHPAEQPAHWVHVTGFWMDRTEVTNAEFTRFVEATSYSTTAERRVDWEQLKTQVPPGTPKPPDTRLAPGSLVFTPPTHRIPLDDIRYWWEWVPGADWRHPDGPNSSIVGKDIYPVVHISWDDAAAYAKWAGKSLPTEAQWEFASRGGLSSKKYAWGDEFQVNGRYQANTWQGHFPETNSGNDGFPRLAPVGSFPPNGYGLYDMIGNVWEWCSDWYRPDAYRLCTTSPRTLNPTGPKSSYDPEEPYQPKRVTRGGSFLCSANYCTNYRPSARRGTATDSGMSHLGFRCVLNPVSEAQEGHAEPGQP